MFTDGHERLEDLDGRLNGVDTEVRTEGYNSRYGKC